jgi:hypothetical protein
MRKIQILLATAFLLAGNPLPAAEGASDVGIPYNSVNTTMIPLKSQKIKGVDCVAWYVRDTRKDTVLDPGKARFRIRTWEGAEVPLEIEALSSVPADQLTAEDKEVIKENGFTHRMWIPKADKRFMDGDILHSLPHGSVDMGQGITVSAKLPLGKKG